MLDGVSPGHRPGAAENRSSGAPGRGVRVNKAAFALAAVFLAAALYLALRPGGETPAGVFVPEDGVILCFGDSLTYGTGSSPGMDYPSRLSVMLGRPVINAGRPGDTTAGALERLDQDVLSHAPALVLITLGGNDLKNRLPYDQAFANLGAIITRIRQETGALVVVGGIRVPFVGRDLAHGYERVCRETGAVLVPDVYEGIFGRRKLMSDPIHPNDKGYRIMAERFHEAIRPYL